MKTLLALIIAHSAVTFAHERVVNKDIRPIGVYANFKWINQSCNELKLRLVGLDALLHCDSNEPFAVSDYEASEMDRGLNQANKWFFHALTEDSEFELERICSLANQVLDPWWKRWQPYITISYAQQPQSRTQLCTQSIFHQLLRQ